MSAATITEHQKLVLRNKAKAELLRLETYLSNQSTVQIVDAFKNKFNLCETVYKIILAEYVKHKKSKSKDSLKIIMNQVPAALKFAGYTFDKALLNEIFGSSSNNKKNNTIKRLRNATTHGIKKKAVEEIISRKDELFGYMDTFLCQIHSHDSNAV